MKPTVLPAVEMEVALEPLGQADTVIIACAALGKEVRAIIRKHHWRADLRVINARLHLRPALIGAAVEKKLAETRGSYRRQVVVYGRCGATGLDEVIARHGAVRTMGPHCFEMFGGDIFAESITEQPGTFFLTDFLIKAWEPSVIKGLKLDSNPKLAKLMFRNYTRIMYLVQQDDDALTAKAGRIADSLGLPLEIRNTGLGGLESRLVAIMNNQPQPTSSLNFDVCNNITER